MRTRLPRRIPLGRPTLTSIYGTMSGAPPLGAEVDDLDGSVVVSPGLTQDPCASKRRGAGCFKDLPPFSCDSQELDRAPSDPHVVKEAEEGHPRNGRSDRSRDAFSGSGARHPCPRRERSPQRGRDRRRRDSNAVRREEMRGTTRDAGGLAGMGGAARTRSVFAAEPPRLAHGHWNASSVEATPCRPKLAVVGPHASASLSAR